MGKKHAGTIITDRPDVMGEMDATRFFTEQEGWCWFFGAIDHGITSSWVGRGQAP